MQIELFIFAISTLCYGLFISVAIIGILKLKANTKDLEINQTPEFISIVISARNEAATIKKCIEQITEQLFDKNYFELLLLDDASEDETYNISKDTLNKSNINFRLIKQLNHKGKKNNLTQGIEIAKGSIIITSDADITERSPHWLSLVSSYFATYSPNLLIMPIDFEIQSGILSKFQLIENWALTAVSAGYAGIKYPFMCNGANLAFTKKSYQLVNGYKSHIHISSGDDVFLLEDMKKLNPQLVHYCYNKHAIVKTRPITSIQEFINQRIRWAYKAKYNTNKINAFGGLIVLISNLIFVALVLAIIKNTPNVFYFVTFAVVKFVFDFLLLFLASNFLGRRKYIGLIVLFECVYWIYALIVGISALFTKPHWKGKKIN